MENKTTNEKQVLNFLLELSKRQDINSDIIQALKEIIDENETLRKANTYNQSLLNIYNKWFEELHASIDTKEDRNTPIFNDEPRTYNTKTIITFPELAFGGQFDDNILKALEVATKNLTVDCETCKNGVRSLFYDGHPIYKCPDCGRILK